jgi:hypothetical protein
MDAMRCKQCGDVRWSFSGLAGGRELHCELCGEAMVPERRQPHRGARRDGEERRGLQMTGLPGPPDRRQPSAR